MKPYPLIFEPIFKEKVWGGRRLEHLGKALPPDVNVGESWEIADLASTSADGAGGDAAHSMIVNGEMRGISLRDAIRAMGPNLMGNVRMDEDGSFPLLIKFLDARENLSVQVHPSEAYAAANPDAHLKTESWYVLDAAPDAVIYKGVKPGVSAEQFAAHIKDDTVVDDMIAIPVTKGDVHHLPSGTCHALGEGVVIAEVQIPSDTTFRVYDWGRKGRALHVEQALQCIDFGPPEREEAIRSDGSHRSELVTTDYYVMTELRAMAEDEGDVDVGGASPVVWMVLEGAGRLSAKDESYESLDFEAGQTILLPAALAASSCYVTRDLVVLEVSVPVG